MDKPLHIFLRSLEKFETKNCSWLSAHDVTIYGPLLQSVLVVQDLESVTREPRSCTIKFSASCMKEFTYQGYGGISQPIVLSNPSAARDAFVKIMLDRSGSYVQETGSCACLLLKCFSQAKRIEFHGSEVLTQANMIVLSRFAMLSHLDLGVITGEVLLSLLQKSPILNTLVLKEISTFDQELLNSAAVPECLASSLRFVKFGSVDGSQPELFLAKYFMENGVVLERMSFCIVNGWLSNSKYICAKCVVCEDIKVSNIMLDSEFNAKLGDFDLIRFVDHAKGAQTTALAGTIGYLTHEFAITGRASNGTDVLSLGGLWKKTSTY
ncbi:uncharacterized protein LOC131613286 [Vicia villosa]|uniref:uncharacterized protein LOC131613286 n=1 Tax=Vicia villosa TaxID=3911 RepID=UPI00273B4F22|nr:uncharacterized protein LOC131613286 [Vicia villosa]